MPHLCCDLNTISAVIEAMRWYMFVNGTMFQVLVHDLFEGDSLLFKVWIIVPINDFQVFVHGSDKWHTGYYTESS